MKKNFFKIFVAVAVMALMTACSGGLNGLISDYEKACEAGDVEKAHQIEAQLEEKYSVEDLSEDQVARLATAAMTLYMNKSAVDVLNDVYDEADEYVNDAYDQAKDLYKDAYDQAEEYMNDAYDQAEEYMNNAQKQANDMYNDAMKQAEDIMNAYGF